MIFPDLRKSPRSPLAKFRHHHHAAPPSTQPVLDAAPPWLEPQYADLVVKDKAKQKEAVKRYLADNVRSDWHFPWPPPAPGPPFPFRHVQTPPPPSDVDPATAAAAPPQLNSRSPSPSTSSSPSSPLSDGGKVGHAVEATPQENGLHRDSDSNSNYSLVSEDVTRYRPRLDWASDLSDYDLYSPSSDTPASPLRPLQMDKRARRRRALRREMTWNHGLACFEARRDAWTGARTVRVRGKPMSAAPASPRSSRRFFFRRSISTSPPASATSATDGSGASSDNSSLLSHDFETNGNGVRARAGSIPASTAAHTYPVQTILPLGQPLLPPESPLRSSITPASYLGLYDKIIIHNMQPACPVNLADVLRSCVAGWKRDGEWPPRPSPADPVLAVRKKKAPTPAASVSTAPDRDKGGPSRRMSFGLLGRDKEDEPRTGKGIRRSLQRALGGIGIVPGASEPQQCEDAKERGADTVRPT